MGLDSLLRNFHSSGGIEADGIPGDTLVAWSPVEGKALGKLSKNRWGGAGHTPIEDGRWGERVGSGGREEVRRKGEIDFGFL